MNKRVLFLSISLFLLSLSTIEGQVDLRQFVDTNHIRIGEQVSINLVLISHSDKSLEVTWPFATDTLSENIEIINVFPVDTQKYEDEIIFTQLWHVTSFDTGFQEVPPFEVIIDGIGRETDSFLIKVETVEVDTTQAIRDIKGVEDVPISIFEWIKYHWKWFAAFAVLAILVFGIYLIIKNKNKELVFKKPKAPSIPHHQHALERLDKLKEGKWWQQGDVKHYHASISEILREYLEHQYEFPALEQTTREVMRSLRLTSIDAAQQKHINRILLLSDLVKYAKEKPLSDENKEMILLAANFIHETKPEEAQEIEKEEEKNEA